MCKELFRVFDQQLLLKYQIECERGRRVIMWWVWY